MKRLIRAVAVAAPFVAVVIWFALSSDVSSGSDASRFGNRPGDDPNFGRTRELPATGPIAAPGGPNDTMLPVDRVREIMPHLSQSLFEQPRGTRS